MAKEAAREFPRLPFLAFTPGANSPHQLSVQLGAPQSRRRTPRVCVLLLEDASWLGLLMASGVLPTGLPLGIARVTAGAARKFFVAHLGVRGTAPAWSVYAAHKLPLSCMGCTAGGGGGRRPTTFSLLSRGCGRAGGAKYGCPSRTARCNAG